ncbi:DUF2987 domain-containing protein [Roseateles sp. BYS87W]|uniref:DUF2987 domain-containing protein n=1 Tax=Pelomonas baiyunensis TaxID=3299026 RepID=A0ABW7GUR4_9BURK
MPKPDPPCFSLYDSMFLPPSSRILSTTLCTALLAAPPAVAQEDSDTQVLPTVHTELKRDPTVLPYRRLNEVLTKLQVHGQNLFRMDFRVNTEKTKMPLGDVRMVVRTDDHDYPLRIDPMGLIQLPVLPEAEAASAEFATNAPKGQLSVRLSLELNTPADQLTMGKVREIVKVGRSVREDLLPWALRWLLPRVQGVRICSPAPGWQLEWTEAEQVVTVPLPVATDERDELDRKTAQPRPCALLTGQERWPDTARLLPSPATRLSVKL